MISRETGAIVLLLLPLIPLCAAILTKSTERRRIHEILFGVAIASCLVLSLLYTDSTKLAQMAGEPKGSSFLETFFDFFFASQMIPIVYFLGIAAIYFGLIRRAD